MAESGVEGAASEGEGGLAMTTSSWVPRLSDETALSALVVGKEEIMAAEGSPPRYCGSGLSMLLGRAHTVYLIEVRYKDQCWVVRRRYRDLLSLHNTILPQDGKP